MTIVTIRFTTDEAEELIGAIACVIHENVEHAFSKLPPHKQYALKSAWDKIIALKSDTEIIGGVECAAWPKTDFIA